MYTFTKDEILALLNELSRLPYFQVNNTIDFLKKKVEIQNQEHKNQEDENQEDVKPEEIQPEGVVLG